MCKTINMYDDKVLGPMPNRTRVLCKDRNFPAKLQPKPFSPSKFKTCANPFPLEYLRTFIHIGKNSALIVSFRSNSQGRIFYIREESHSQSSTEF